MKTLTNRKLALGLALATLIGPAAVLADEPKSTDSAPLPSWRVVAPIRPVAVAPPAPRASGFAIPAPPTAPSATESILTPDNIVAKLEQTGLPVKVEGKNSFTVTVKQGTWTAPVTMALSNGGTSVWMILTVKKDLPTYDQISGERLARLLEANDEIGPCHFSLDRTTRALKINVAVPNRAVSPEMLRTDIEAFVEKALSTKNLWAD